MLRTSEGRMTCVLIDFGVSRKLDEFSTPYVENESPVGGKFILNLFFFTYL